MSGNYLNQMFVDSYQNGIKKLKKLRRGKVLVEAQLERIFGSFGYDEYKDAFSKVLKERYLLEVSPGKFITNFRTREQEKNISAGDLMAIEHIINEASLRVKNLIMDSVRKHKNFPIMNFGVRDNKKRKSCEARGMLTSVDITQYAVAVEKGGIVLHKEDKFWDQASIVVLTTEGMFECSYVMSGKLGSSMLMPLPDWERRKESDLLWLMYAKKAIDELTLYSA